MREEEWSRCLCAQAPGVEEFWAGRTLRVYMRWQVPECLEERYFAATWSESWAFKYYELLIQNTARFVSLHTAFHNRKSHFLKWEPHLCPYWDKENHRITCTRTHWLLRSPEMGQQSFIFLGKPGIMCMYFTMSTVPCTVCSVKCGRNQSSLGWEVLKVLTSLNGTT